MTPTTRIADYRPEDVITRSGMKVLGGPFRTEQEARLALFTHVCSEERIRQAAVKRERKADRNRQLVARSA